jgi:hypothetical protein
MKGRDKGKEGEAAGFAPQNFRPSAHAPFPLGRRRLAPGSGASPPFSHTRTSLCENLAFGRSNGCRRCGWAQVSGQAIHYDEAAGSAVAGSSVDTVDTVRVRVLHQVGGGWAGRQDSNWTTQMVDISRWLSLHGWQRGHGRKTSRAALAGRLYRRPVLPGY